LRDTVPPNTFALNPLLGRSAPSARKANMVSLMSVWLPILIGAVLVFIASFVVHTVFTYHQNDLMKLPNEEQAADALRPLAIPPGDYMLPKPANAKAMGSPEFQQQLTKGPVVMMTVYPNGPMTMGTQLAQWFVFCVVVGIFAAYVATRTLAPGTAYLQVFRITGTVAFAGYGLAMIQDAIWFRRNWGALARSLVDAFVYAMLTAGALAWLWPG
jgi:hypothetical protein